MSSYRIYSGHRYGKLITVEFAGRKGKFKYWSCACDCGRKTILRVTDLIDRKATSCGRCS